MPAAPRADWRYWSTESNYAQLRKEAEEWQAKRTAYMMERLTAGRHPDTDPTFWAEYKETPAPPISNAPGYVQFWWSVEKDMFFFLVMVGTFAAIPLFIRSRWITFKTGRPSGFPWGILFILLVLGIGWFFNVVLSGFAKARG